MDAPIQGVIANMPSDEYHAMPGVSNSMLSAMSRSPQHCYALYMQDGRPRNAPTPAMMAGTLAHCAILEPDALLSRYAVRPVGLDGRTKDGKQWMADNAELEQINEAQYTVALSQRAAVFAVDELAAILSSGAAELSAFWRDDDTGELCRCRPDWTHDHGDGTVTLLDLKTTTDAGPEEFARTVAKYGYHRQAWHYSRGFERASGKRVRRFVFAAVSNAFPFVAAAYVLDEETEAQACEEVSELMALYKQCKKSGEWPAYGNGAHIIGLPAWARRSNELEIGYV